MVSTWGAIDTYNHIEQGNMDTKATVPGSNQVSPLTASQYAANSIGGMPTCVHCLNQFTRVEGLKKHINSGCEAILRKQRRAETAAEGTGQVPDTRAELPRGAGLHRQSLQRRATL